MKRIIYSILLMLAAVSFTACEDYETYGDKKEKERNAINRFLKEHDIHVISEATFKAQGETTDLASNEYVLFSQNGVYMQIIRQGCGEKLEENKVVNLLCRFMEYNILEDSLLVCNDRDFYFYNSTFGQYLNAAQYVDKMNVKRTGTTLTASFVEGMMMTFHSTSASVPGGWLVPLNYVKVGRPEKEGDETAKVRLIVPHSQGTADATSSVYPCFYEITYQREK